MMMMYKKQRSHLVILKQQKRNVITVMREDDEEEVENFSQGKPVFVPTTMKLIWLINPSHPKAQVVFIPWAVQTLMMMKKKLNLPEKNSK